MAITIMQNSNLMKRINLYSGILVAMSFLFFGCNDSENDLLESKLYFESDVISVETEEDTYECELVSRLSSMVGNDVAVNYSVGGQDLVDQYNQKHGTSCLLMPEGNYEMAGHSSVIKAGELYADACTVSLKNITKGEDGVTYVLPLLVNSSDITMMNGENVTYITPNWLDVRLPKSCASMGSVTYEALLYAERWNNLGTIMGNEGILILRTGDLNHPDNEIQVAGNVQLQIPSDVVSSYSLNKWYHVAFTYDSSSGMAAIYMNGEKVAEKSVGSGLTFDLNQHFSIGYAYDYDSRRTWYGFMSEVRLWSVARTANQLRDNMMYVDPTSDGLVGYWKLNGEDYYEENGVWYVKDQSPNGNNATSNRGLRGDNGGSQTFVEPTVVDMRVKIE